AVGPLVRCRGPSISAWRPGQRPTEPQARPATIAEAAPAASPLKSPIRKGSRLAPREGAASRGARRLPWGQDIPPHALFLFALPDSQGMPGAFLGGEFLWPVLSGRPIAHLVGIALDFINAQDGFVLVRAAFQHLVDR